MSHLDKKFELGNLPDDILECILSQQDENVFQLPKGFTVTSVRPSFVKSFNSKASSLQGNLSGASMLLFHSIHLFENSNE